MITCLLVDDHPVVRAGYRRLLELAGVAVVAEAGSVAAACAAFVEHSPAVTVTDFSLPGASGLELIHRLRARRPDVAILVFSMLDSVVAAARVLEAGARGFVSKDSPPQALVDAVAAVHRGELWLSPELRQRIDAEAWRTAGLRALSDRELEVLRLLAQGQSPEDCARLLNLSRKTVANYQTQIRDKLGIDTGAALAHFALRHRLIDPASLPPAF